MLLVLHNLLLPVTWLGYQQLNHFAHQAFFLMRKVARHLAGLKTRSVKWDQRLCSTHAEK